MKVQNAGRILKYPSVRRKNLNHDTASPSAYDGMQNSIRDQQVYQQYYKNTGLKSENPSPCMMNPPIIPAWWHLPELPGFPWPSVSYYMRPFQHP